MANVEQTASSGELHGTHSEMHSDLGALRGEHPGRSRNPIIKVAGVSWLEFSKPELTKAHTFATAFGFGTVLQTPEKVYLRGTDAGAPSVILRAGPRTKFLGPTFRAADEVDVLRLADATGRQVRPLPDDVSGVAVELTDPSGMPVRVAAGMHELPALEEQPVSAHNYGGELTRINTTVRPALEPARVRRLGHVVLMSPRYQQALQCLTPEERTLLQQFESGSTFQTIANACGIASADAARKRVARLLVRLQQQMGRQS